MYRKYFKKIMNYKIYLLNLVIIQIKNNLKLYQILPTTNIFPISWGGLDKGGLDKGFYGIIVINWVNINECLNQPHFYKLLFTLYKSLKKCIILPLAKYFPTIPWSFAFKYILSTWGIFGGLMESLKLGTDLFLMIILSFIAKFNYLIDFIIFFIYLLIFTKQTCLLLMIFNKKLRISTTNNTSERINKFIIGSLYSAL